jgi:hypothetical protein
MILQRLPNHWQNPHRIFLAIKDFLIFPDASTKQVSEKEIDWP